MIDVNDLVKVPAIGNHDFMSNARCEGCICDPDTTANVQLCGRVGRVLGRCEHHNNIYILPTEAAKAEYIALRLTS